MKSIEMIILDGRGSRTRTYFPVAVLRRARSVLWGVSPTLVFALVDVVGVMRTLVVVVVVRAALIFGVRTTLVVQVLGLGPMHFAGLVLGGLFVRRLALAVAPGVWLALEVG
jgi:hypothetical protein